MQKWTAVFFAVLVVGVLVLLKVSSAPRGTPVGSVASDAGTSETDGGVIALSDAGMTDADMAPERSSEVDPTQQADAGGTVLLSGEAPPALAADAPKSVVFGVVLVTYRGAQGPPGAARIPSTVRSREAALELAKQLAELAKTDFKAAVEKGDKPGSMDNAGRLPRGVLEPAPEYVLFSLPKGGVSEPVDTPRGFWVVQRIE
jgi:hypothetical protein